MSDNQKKVALTEICTFHGGSVQIVMSLATITQEGAQAPVFTLTTSPRPELPPNTITMGELAMLAQLVKAALHQSVSMCSTVPNEES